MTYFGSSGLPLVLAKAGAARALTPAGRLLHQAILRHFVDTGCPPSPGVVDALTGGVQGSIPSALVDLHEADLVLLTEAGEVRAAYPFSPTPTRHQVRLASGVVVYGMCAVDALGISMMADQPVVISSEEPEVARVVEVHVDRADATWVPDSAVVYVVLGDDGATSADSTCSHINFFSTIEAAQSWADRRPNLTGILLNQAEALAVGIAEFGEFLLARP